MPKQQQRPKKVLYANGTKRNMIRDEKENSRQDWLAKKHREKEGIQQVFL
jgi:hypothetical protein